MKKGTQIFVSILSVLVILFVGNVIYAVNRKYDDEEPTVNF